MSIQFEVSRFTDRIEAGRLLAEALKEYANRSDAIVLGLPRGGVPVAREVADRLHVPVDLLLVRKLGVPGQPELAFGAVALGCKPVIERNIVRQCGLRQAQAEEVLRRELSVLEARRKLYGRGRPSVAGRTVIVVDDGIATGNTMRAALQSLKNAGAKKVILAVPVAPPDTVRALRGEADEIVCLLAPPDFRAVGAWYDDFSQVSDEEVLAALHPAQGEESSGVLPVSGGVLHYDLCIPQGARGLVLFAHGSGSSRKSPRNRLVAERLQQQGLGTCLLDLLTPHEEQIDVRTREFRFDIRLLAQRLRQATEHFKGSRLPIGYFGARTDSAAALLAAADNPEDVAAVVSRGGRPDLVGPSLARVLAPTLLIVGAHDLAVLEMNEVALRQLRCLKALIVVPGATHLFEEPGTLEDVAAHAGKWFLRQFGP